MKPAHSHDAPGHALDDFARGVHAQALDALSPRTRAQLELRRRARAAPARPAPFRTLAWPLATACAVAALAIGWQLRQPDSPPPSTTRAPVVATASGENDSPTLALDENPDFYEWLASSEADTLAME